MRFQNMLKLSTFFKLTIIKDAQNRSNLFKERKLKSEDSVGPDILHISV